MKLATLSILPLLLLASCACGGNTLEDAASGDVDIDSDEVSALSEVMERAGTPAEELVLLPRGEEAEFSQRTVAHYANGHVVELRLQFLDLKAFGPLRALDRLERLDLSHNRLSDMNGIDELERLTRLDVSNNRLTRLGDIAKLERLKYLQLNKNRLKSLKGIGRLDALEEMTAASNRLTSLRGVEGCRSLQRIRVRNNAITDLRHARKASALERLYISHNKVETLAPLKGHPTLERLIVHSNALSDLEGVEDMKALSWLGANDNRITTLEHLESLPELSHFDATGNRIEDISPLQRIPNLKKANLKDNDVAELPEGAWVKRINLKGNPVVEKRKAARDKKQRKAIEALDRRSSNKLPSGGRAYKLKKSCKLLGGDIRCRGTISSLKGGFRLELGEIHWSDTPPRVEVTFESKEGSLRAWVRRSDIYYVEEDGDIKREKPRFKYLYREAAPGERATVAGRPMELGSDETLYVVLEAPDGEAEGVRWEVKSD